MARLRQLIAASPGRSLLRFLWWHWCHVFCRLFFILLFRFRVVGPRHLPRDGPVLILANHESFFDPLLIGMSSFPRPIHSLARSTLFKNPLFSWAIRSLNALPVERGAADLASMRHCIDALKAGTALIIFPEGTRTGDGQVQPFKTGALLLVRRTNATVVPMAIDGAFAAWPRGRKLPRLFRRIRVSIGEPVAAETLLAMDQEQAMAMLRQKVVELKEQMTSK